MTDALGDLIRVKVATLYGELEMEAVPCVEAPGLCVHLTPTRSGANIGWSLTHVRAGAAVVAELPTAAAAHELATKLGELVDWTQAGVELRQSPRAHEVRGVIEATVARHGRTVYRNIMPPGDPRMER